MEWRLAARNRIVGALLSIPSAITVHREVASSDAHNAAAIQFFK
jgi:hypothetical protein